MTLDFREQDGWRAGVADAGSRGVGAAIRAERGRKALACGLLLLACLTLIALPGCGGCRRQTSDDEETEKKDEKTKKEKEKPPFEIRRVGTRPNASVLSTAYKPGHWLSLSVVDAKANQADFAGEWETEAQNRNGQPVPLIGTPFTLVSYRPLMLSKGQAKSFEALAWVPPAENAAIQYSMVSGQGSRVGLGGQLGLGVRQWMPSYQYCFLVLARSPAKYEFLGTLVSIQPPLPPDSLEEHKPPYYRVLHFPADRRLELPSHSLYWTTIACILWDDADPANMELEQQQALVDWLHWGGRLLLSGPDTLDRLRGSFLGPYLPATSAGTMQLGEEELSSLAAWNPPSGKPLRLTQPLSGVKLVPDVAHRASWVHGTGQLLVERPVGSGRVVASAFRLNERTLCAWPGYDRLMNHLLRPGKEFPAPAADDLDLTIDPFGVPSNSRVPSKQSPALDARENCRLRYFARDAGVQDYANSHGVARHTKTGTLGPAEAILSEVEDSEPEAQHHGPGVAAWNDFSPVAQRARAALADAAGIRVPNRSFIMWVVAGYLIVLVPLNWVVFRLLGRVEWAWAAAPMIAIGCTILVIHLAQLNIGFVRAQSEIAVVELQEGHARAHVTRFTSLYTSLATQYEVRLDDPGAQVLPFSKVQNPGDFRMAAWDTHQRVVCRRAEDTRLSGFGVASNFVDYLHSEEMVDVGGAVSLAKTADGRLQITNGTQLTLREARVVRRHESGRIEMARVGSLEVGEMATLEFREEPALSSNAGSDLQRSGNAPAREAPSGELSLRELLELARRPDELRDGQFRLVATADGGLPALNVIPVASQIRQATLVVANLGGSLGDMPAKQESGSSTPAASTESEGELSPESPFG